MFKKLAFEEHKRAVTSDHNKMIFEAADDVVTYEGEDEEDMDLADLDQIIDNDSSVVTQEQIDSLEELVGSISETPTKDASQMTKDELKKHVEQADSTSIEELDE